MSRTINATIDSANQALLEASYPYLSSFELIDEGRRFLFQNLPYSDVEEESGEEVFPNIEAVYDENNLRYEIEAYMSYSNSQYSYEIELSKFTRQNSYDQYVEDESFDSSTNVQFSWMISNKKVLEENLGHQPHEGELAPDQTYYAKRGETNADGQQFIRFDQYGLYGIDTALVPELNGTFYAPRDISQVINDSIFSLTWKGFNFKTFHNGSKVDGRVEIGNDSDIVVYDKDNHVVGALGYLDQNILRNLSNEYVGAVQDKYGVFAKNLYIGDSDNFLTYQTYDETLQDAYTVVPAPTNPQTEGLYEILENAYEIVTDYFDVDVNDLYIDNGTPTLDTQAVTGKTYYAKNFYENSLRFQYQVIVPSGSPTGLYEKIDSTKDIVYKVNGVNPLDDLVETIYCVEATVYVLSGDTSPQVGKTYYSKDTVAQSKTRLVIKATNFFLDTGKQLETVLKNFGTEITKLSKGFAEQIEVLDEKIYGTYGLSSYFRVLGDPTEGIMLAITTERDGTDNAMLLDSDSLTFKVNGSQGVVLTNQDFNIPTIYTDQKLSIGNYAWINRSNGHMALKYIPRG